MLAKSSGTGLFFVGSVFFNIFNFISNDWSVQLFYFFLIQFCWAVKSLKSGPFLLGCQIYWNIIVDIILLYCFVFLLRFLLFHFLFCLNFSLLFLVSLARGLSIFFFTFSKNPVCGKSLRMFHVHLNVYSDYF